MARVYLETSVISYLASGPSRNLIAAGHQIATHEWWDKRRHDYELVTSQEVIEEIADGDPVEAKKRLKWVEGVRLLTTSADARKLARKLLQTRTLPPKAAADALHLAIAVTHQVDFLLTWNCKHLANAAIRHRIEEVCKSLGFSPTVICTPDELLAEEEGNV